MAQVDPDQLAAFAVSGPRSAPSRSSRSSATKALDDLMRKLLVVHRLLEAEERLTKREPRADPM